MVNREWKADPGVLEDAARSFAALAATGDAPALLEAAGRLVALDAPAAVTAWAEGRPDRGRSVAEALAAGDAFDALEDAAVALRAILDRRALGTGDVSLDELTRGVREALGVRDRVELSILGAAAILGRAPALGPAQESAILVFESLVRPAAFRLTEANEIRREALARIAPARRASFWWWSEGADVAAHAVAALPAVAHLVARFPAASEALATLASAQRTWDEAARERRAADVVSLGAWLRRRAGEARAVPGAALALAAATMDEEITIVDTPGYQVSWAPPDALVIDLVADRAPDARPALRLADGSTVASTPVAGAEERFSLRADAALLEQGRVVIVLPLAAGTVEIPLPPDAR